MAAVQPQQLQRGDPLLEDAKTAFFDFLTTYRSEALQDPADDTPYYLHRVMRMKAEENVCLYVDFSDVKAHSADLADTIENNYYRLEPGLRKAAQDVVRQVAPTYAVDDDGIEREFFVNIFNLQVRGAFGNMRRQRGGRGG
jgi:DNA replicative helicase MCM subunit Mcm2 (Cdc46/Mcm family)